MSLASPASRPQVPAEVIRDAVASRSLTPRPVAQDASVPTGDLRRRSPGRWALPYRRPADEGGRVNASDTPRDPAPHPAGAGERHPDPVVELRGRIAPDLADYVRHKIGAVLAHTRRAALHVHVRVVRHADPARERPVSARGLVDLAGRPLYAHVDATTPREAVDLLLDRLDRRIAGTVRGHRRDVSRARASRSVPAAGAVAPTGPEEPGTGATAPTG